MDSISVISTSGSASRAEPTSLTRQLDLPRFALAPASGVAREMRHAGGPRALKPAKEPVRIAADAVKKQARNDPQKKIRPCRSGACRGGGGRDKFVGSIWFIDLIYIWNSYRGQQKGTFMPDAYVIEVSERTAGIVGRPTFFRPAAAERVARMLGQAREPAAAPRDVSFAF
jgi:hypothetical protein